MKQIFSKLSRKLHKYVGLICLFWFILMGVSGVLINHPGLIRAISVPSAFVPSILHYVNWNRMAMRDAVYSLQTPDMLFICGRKGVWQSKDGGQTFLAMDNGYPSSAFEKYTNCLLLTETSGFQQLYAGNRAGLFLWNFESEKWEKIKHKALNHTEVKDIILVGRHPLVFTADKCFSLQDQGQKPVLLPLIFNIPPLNRISMTRFMLGIHDGSIAGLPGKLLVDAVGLALVFMSFSAIVLWYLPRHGKIIFKPRLNTQVYRFFRRYHLKLGIYCVFLLMGITVTGMMIRPPFRQIVLNETISSTWLHFSRLFESQVPGIRRAAYLKKEDTLILGTRTGFFTGPADFSHPFTPIPIDVPVSGMGVSLMKSLSGNRLLIGSFDGLYVRNGNTGAVAAVVENIKNMPVNFENNIKKRAVGAAVKKGQLQFWVDYNRGAISVGPHGLLPRMPGTLENKARMSLYRYLRGVHTGHIFRKWLGQYTWLIIPAGGLILILSLVTGGYDWLHRKGVFSLGDRPGKAA